MQHVSAGQWPSTFRRDRALVGDPHARGKGEEAQRKKWLAELHQLVMESRLPVVEVASRMKDPSVLLAALGKGRRWRTLKRRVLDWKRAQRYFTLTTAHPWPQHVAQVWDYLGV